MTLHKSKGLEFNIVFHMDMYKYIISDEWGDEEQIKQLLNLHYVGVTRAIDACYIMIGTKRYRAKKNDFYKAEPSSFLVLKGYQNVETTFVGNDIYHQILKRTLICGTKY